MIELSCVRQIRAQLKTSVFGFLFPHLAISKIRFIRDQSLGNPCFKIEAFSDTEHRRAVANGRQEAVAPSNFFLANNLVLSRYLKRFRFWKGLVDRYAPFLTRFDFWTDCDTVH